MFFFCSGHLQHCISASASAMFCLHPIEQQINPVSNPLKSKRSRESKIRNKSSAASFQTSIFFLRQAVQLQVFQTYPHFPTISTHFTQLTYWFFVVRNRRVSGSSVSHTLWFSLLKSYRRRSTWVWLSRALTHTPFLGEPLFRLNFLLFSSRL